MRFPSFLSFAASAASSETRSEASDRAKTDPAFAEALRTASEKKTSPSERRAYSLRVGAEDDGCPICVAMRGDEAAEGGGAGDTEVWTSEDGEFSFTSEVLDPAQLQARMKLMMAMGGVRGPDQLSTASALTATILAPTETAAVLASMLQEARWHLDRHRRFDLEVYHPVHGAIRLRGSLKESRLRVSFQASQKAQQHLRASREPLSQALLQEGLELVSFLPEAPQRR